MSSAPKQRKRSARDLYITPIGVTEALIDELERRLGWGAGAQLRILDIGAGTGRISEACRAQWPDAHITAVEIDEAHSSRLMSIADHVVIADYLDGDFDDILLSGFDLVIGNPPYSLALQFLERALATPARPGRSEPLIALLVNMNFLGSDERVDYFDQHEPISQRVLAPRPSFTHEETGKLETDSVEYAWMLWSRSPRAICLLRPFGWYVWRMTAKRLKALLEREEVAAKQ